MAHNSWGNFQVATVTVEPGGYVDVFPIRSNTVYKNVSVGVIPLDDHITYKHAVGIYMYEELEESHIYNDDSKHISFMTLPDKIFPPNVGLKTNPEMVRAALYEPALNVIKIRIANAEAETRHFQVYGTFECLDTVMKAVGK
ncbi:MAG: hypothetical protein WC444_04960 [Candidatus Paceibacterota bacterium]